MVLLGYPLPLGLGVAISPPRPSLLPLFTCFLPFRSQLRHDFTPVPLFSPQWEKESPEVSYSQMQHQLPGPWPEKVLNSEGVKEFTSVPCTSPVLWQVDFSLNTTIFFSQTPLCEYESAQQTVAWWNPNLRIFSPKKKSPISFKWKCNYYYLHAMLSYEWDS